MAGPGRTINRSLWQRAYDRISLLPPERQEEIVDYSDFVVEREEGETWDLSEVDKKAIDRHRDGDISDTVPLVDVKDAIIRGRPRRMPSPPMWRVPRSVSGSRRSERDSHREDRRARVGVRLTARVRACLAVAKSAATGKIVRVARKSQ